MPKKLQADQVDQVIKAGTASRSPLPVAPRFQVGDVVKVRVAHPETYTRCTRYVRGKKGKIYQDHGVFVFADTVGQLKGDHPQHVYTVSFTAQELWGPAASERDTVLIDLFDDHLDPV